MGDITIRSIKILKEVDFIYTETKNKAIILLNYYNIKKPIYTFNIINEYKILPKIIDKLNNKKTIALISNAGTPCISDPGYILIEKCLNKSIDFEVLPGPTALIPAIIQSGFPCHNFIFEGYCNIKKVKTIIYEKRTVIFYVSPHKLIKTLTLLIKYLGSERKCSISREISKLYEEHYRGTLIECLNYFNKKNIKGEFVVLIKGL
ncbi:MAG: rRNA small subunit methyltransferase 1 [Bacteroides sp.]|nr:MAG: rRNA small subunit methyltransferase 1 [Bacteroides sp.]